MRNQSVCIILSVVMTFAFTAAAQADPIKDRRASMKSISKANKPARNILRGKAKFDIAKVQAALKVFQEEAIKSKALYPSGSDKGKTRAKPAVWSDKKDFLSRLDKFAADAKAASKAIKDEATFKVSYKAVLKNCGGCHKLYRAPKKKKKK